MEELRQRLDSWKEIADYLGREVRTVIRWEKYRALPVHRLPGEKRSAVYAYREEIDQWLQQQEKGKNGRKASALDSLDAPPSAAEPLLPIEVNGAPAPATNGHSGVHPRAARTIIPFAVAAAVVIALLFAIQNFIYRPSDGPAPLSARLLLRARTSPPACPPM